MHFDLNKAIIVETEVSEYISAPIMPHKLTTQYLDQWDSYRRNTPQLNVITNLRRGIIVVIWAFEE